MFTLTRLLSWRYLRKHTVRMVLATVSIALGVATLVATRVLNHTTLTAMTATSTQLAGQADLVITGGELGVPVGLLDAVRQTPGVAAAAPLVVQRLDVLLGDGQRGRALLLGVDLRADAQFRSFGKDWQTHLRTPDWSQALAILANPGPVGVIGPALLADLPPDAKGFDVLAAGAVRRVWIGGTIDLGAAGAIFGGRVIIVPYKAALLLLGNGDRVNRIDVKLAEGADRDQVQAALRQAVAGRAEVAPPQAGDSRLDDLLGGVLVGLNLGATIALFVGMFLTYNTLAVTVAERRHDIGILRALGATQGQVRGLFAMEGLILGAVGSAAGVGGGVLLARLSLKTVEQVLQQQFAAIDLHRLEVTPGVLLLGLAAGLVASLAAALAPAAAAAAEPPSDALRRVPSQAHPLRAYGPVMVILGCVAAAGLAYLGRDLLPTPRAWSYLSIYLLGVGFMFATPLLARLGVALIRPVVRPLGPMVCLAADDLARSPSRTGLTVGALALGLALAIETSGLLISTREPIFEWLGNTVRADLLVTSGSAFTGGGNQTPMEPALGAELARIPGVRDVLAARLVTVDYGKTRLLVCAVPLPIFRKYNRSTVTAGDPTAIERMTDPACPEVMVSANLLAQQGLAIGDDLELSTPHGKKRWRIAAAVNNFAWNRGTVFLDREAYLRHFGDPLVDSFDLYLEPGADPRQVRQALLAKLGRAHDLVALTNEEFRTHVDQMMDRFYSLVYANSCMALFVAFLGVANTLAIAVLQRRRELGLLRAVGATRGQVASSIAAQALLIGVLGLVLGVLIGVVLEQYVLQVLVYDETGFVFAFLFPTTMTLLVTAFALAGAQVAGAVPAWSAARLPVSEAVAYE